ncbi:MAG: hypothetical protein IPO30_11425 [Hyphomonadaceae bacterium]|nr:hypothetical protein [Hyphomonadaceae bacterium]
MVAAEPQTFGERVADWPLANDEPNWFRFNGNGPSSGEYYGLSIAEDSAVGPLSISVAQAGGAHAMVESVIDEFAFDIAWIIPVIVVLTLVAGVLAIRSGLAPVTRASQIAAEIGPSTTAVRLPEQDIPTEIAPLVAAMNRALGRLDKGFAVQRAFTANAAHELRTPLAILTAALDSMAPSRRDRQAEGRRGAHEPSGRATAGSLGSMRSRSTFPEPSTSTRQPNQSWPPWRPWPLPCIGRFP